MKSINDFNTVITSVIDKMQLLPFVSISYGGKLTIYRQ